MNIGALSDGQIVALARAVGAGINSGLAENPFDKIATPAHTTALQEQERVLAAGEARRLADQLTGLAATGGVGQLRQFFGVVFGAIGALS